MSLFTLSTHVRHLKQLRRADFSSFDDFYLGDNTCFNNRSLSSDYGALKEAVHLLKEQSKRVFVSLVEFPLGDELPKVYKFVDKIRDLPIDGLELSSMGMLHRLKDTVDPRWELHGSKFANVYTTLTAKLLKDMGITRIHSNGEISFDLMHRIEQDSGLEVIYHVHGKLMLTPLVSCIFKSVDREFKCGDHAQDTDKQMVLDTDRWSDSKVLLCYGKSMYSAKDYCMIEHLAEMRQKGARHFYVNTWNESPATIERTSRIYRDGLERVFAEGSDFDVADALAELEKMSEHGFANGFYFSRSGSDFVSGGAI